MKDGNTKKNKSLCILTKYVQKKSVHLYKETQSVPQKIVDFSLTENNES